MNIVFKNIAPLELIIEKVHQMGQYLCKLYSGHNVLMCDHISDNEIHTYNRREREEWATIIVCESTQWPMAQEDCDPSMRVRGLQMFEWKSNDHFVDAIMQAGMLKHVDPWVTPLEYIIDLFLYVFYWQASRKCCTQRLPDMQWNCGITSQTHH